MTARIIKNISQKILIAGINGNNIDKLLKIIELGSNYEYIVLNGNLYDLKNNFDELRNIISIINEKVICNLGANDLLLINGLITMPDDIESWYIKQPNLIILEFINSTRIIITNGGITKKMTKKSILDNTETTFVSNIDNKPWHELYDGRLGYVISNNPLTLKEPVFYKYSVQMGNLPESSYIYAQEADQYGLKKTIRL